MTAKFIFLAFVYFNFLTKGEMGSLGPTGSIGATGVTGATEPRGMCCKFFLRFP
jgi:hypothetical protein